MDGIRGGCGITRGSNQPGDTQEHQYYRPIKAAYDNQHPGVASTAQQHAQPDRVPHEAPDAMRAPHTHIETHAQVYTCLIAHRVLYRSASTYRAEWALTQPCDRTHVRQAACAN
jgi:hypothetical protein